MGTINNSHLVQYAQLIDEEIEAQKQEVTQAKSLAMELVRPR